jgi:hypothetical protein
MVSFFLPKLSDAVLAVGSTKSVSGISNAQLDMWRRSRIQLLSSVLGANSAFPTAVPTIRLWELESIRRMTKDSVHSEQIERLCRWVATHAPSRKPRQRIGDCAETVPLAVMANIRGRGSVVTITVVTQLVKDIRPLIRSGEFTARIVSHDPCVNCRFLFSRAELRGLTVMDVTSVDKDRCRMEV